MKPTPSLLLLFQIWVAENHATVCMHTRVSLSPEHLQETTVHVRNSLLETLRGSNESNCTENRHYQLKSKPK